MKLLYKRCYISQTAGFLSRTGNVLGCQCDCKAESTSDEETDCYEIENTVLHRIYPELMVLKRNIADFASGFNWQNMQCLLEWFSSWRLDRGP